MRQHAADNLFQNIPPLYPSSPFPSIDYVATPFAELLDAIASIMILWTTSAIVNRLMTIPFGKDTRSIVLKRMFDRLMNLSFASCGRFRAHSHCKNSFASLLFRVISISFFVVLGGMELLVIFSQTYQQKTRSLDVLNLKSPTIQIPQNESQKTGFFKGCVPLLSGDRTSISLVLTLCNYEEFDYGTRVARRNGFEFQFNSSDWRFFEVYESQSFVDLYSRISVEIRDPRRSALYFANMTRLGFSMTPPKLEWLLRKLNEICASCNASADFISPVFSVIRSDINPIVDETKSVDVGILFADEVQSMLRLSNRQLKTKDFLGHNGQDDESKQGLLEMTSDRVKRVSGLTLWIVLAALAIINLVTSRLMTDVDDDVNDIVASVLACPPGTSLLDCDNTRFSIVDTHPPSLQREMADETEQHIF